jgi:hypothetical protein
LEQEVDEKELQTLVDGLVPFYDKNPTHEDIAEAMKSNVSPTGQKVTQALPQIRESLYRLTKILVF